MAKPLKSLMDIKPCGGFLKRGEKRRRKVLLKSPKKHSSFLFYSSSLCKQQINIDTTVCIYVRRMCTLLCTTFSPWGGKENLGVKEKHARKEKREGGRELPLSISIKVGLGDGVGGRRGKITGKKGKQSRGGSGRRRSGGGRDGGMEGGSYLHKKRRGGSSNCKQTRVHNLPSSDTKKEREMGKEMELRGGRWEKGHHLSFFSFFSCRDEIGFLSDNCFSPSSSSVTAPEGGRGEREGIRGEEEEEEE